MAAKKSKSSFRQELVEAANACQREVSYRRHSNQVVTASQEQIVECARDLGTRFHALCTKLAIALRPPRSQDASEAIENDLHDMLPQIRSLCVLLQDEVHGRIVVDVIFSRTRRLLQDLSKMVDTGPEDRLINTGVLWESCQDLQTVDKAYCMMSRKVKNDVQMIHDAEDELGMFSRGEIVDDFSIDVLSDSGTEDDESETESQTIQNDPDIERRVSMIQRIQILLKAIEKRKLVVSSSIDLFNDIYDHLDSLTTEVDEFAVQIQDLAPPALIMELEKAVVHRVEGIIDATMKTNKDDKWNVWIDSFRKLWLKDSNATDESQIITYSTSPSYMTFFESHLLPLKPCIIKGLLCDWQSAKDWCKTDADGTDVPCYEYLRQEFGHIHVNVTRVEPVETAQMLFSDFLNDMEAGKTLYARDIHLMKQFPDHNIYNWPELFRDDWLNFQLEQQADDYKFVYIGADQTRTKLHKDVVASHSWSSNLTGIKEWTLIPPSFADDLFTFDGDEIISDIYLDDAVTRARWPNLSNIRNHAIVVLQQPGETIFVPSTWYHQVRNIGPTLSINHNWINAVSLEAIFDNLMVESAMSAEAVKDLKEDGIVDEAGFVAVVEDLTLANAGMNWRNFFDLIECRFAHQDMYDEYVAPGNRPTRTFEKAVVLAVCTRWKTQKAAVFLPEVAATISKICAIIQEEAQ